MTRRGATGFAGKLRAFAAHLVDEGDADEGRQRRYRFENTWGASVIVHTRGPRAGVAEVAMLRWDTDEPSAAVTNVFDPDQTLVSYHDTGASLAAQLDAIRTSPPPTGTDAYLLTPVAPAPAPGQKGEADQ